MSKQPRNQPELTEEERFTEDMLEAEQRGYKVKHTPAWEADGRFSFKGRGKFHKPSIGDLSSDPAKQGRHK